MSSAVDKIQVVEKLKSLDAYSDEMLPEYILVMMANKKTQEDMTRDLQDFIGRDKAREFTSWLFAARERGLMQSRIKKFGPVDNPVVARNPRIPVQEDSKLVKCRFDYLCKNPNCPFVHSSPAKTRGDVGTVPCQYHPYCNRPGCPYLHPKLPPCRYQQDCRRPDCIFQHSYTGPFATPCKFGPNCRRFDCPFTHPSRISPEDTEMTDSV